MKIKAIYDNGGKTFDRFTVYYTAKQGNYWQGRGMSENPCHPQGFGQWCSGMLGRHNGKRIEFDALPAGCKALVLSDLKGGAA